MRIPFVFAISLLLFVSAPAADAPLKTAPIATKSGAVIGADENGVRVFRGIPYAEPPVGNMRWKYALDPKPWTGARVCLAFGPVCPQPTVPLYGDLGPSSEDCLYLNVWTGAKVTGDPKITDEKRPVLFWVHGGGFVIGAASQSWYDGTPLAIDGAVVVSCNYRLGPFGFLAHPELTAEAQEHASGNYGLTDILAALRWTQANIASFGGDPDNITIWGESAGAAAVIALMTYQTDVPLFQREIFFQRAIVMSTNTAVPMRFRDKRNGDLQSMEELGGEFQKRLNAASLAEMRSKTPAEIIKAARPGSAIPGVSTTDSICVDGRILTAPIADQFANQKVLRCRMMIGNVADEGSMFERKLKFESVAKYSDFMKQRFGEKSAQALTIYPAATDADVRPAMTDLFSDIFFRSTRLHARAMLALPPVDEHRVFVYQFTRKAKPMVDSGIGVFHGSELPFFFGTVKDTEKYTDEDRELSRLIRIYLVNFARTGNPNPELAPQAPNWPAYSLDAEQHLNLDTPISGGEKLHAKTLDALEKMEK